MDLCFIGLCSLVVSVVWMFVTSREIDGLSTDLKIFWAGVGPKEFLYIVKVFFYFSCDGIF